MDDSAPAYAAPAPERPDTPAAPPALLPFPTSFPAFIAALTASKEFLLAGVLENQCACDGWSADKITLRADPAADAIITQRLRAALQRFEGGERIALHVTVADDGEILSEAEKHRASYDKAKQAVLNSADMRRIKQAFPKARIVNIAL